MTSDAALAKIREAFRQGRYFLHSHRIRFRQPTTGEEIEVVSPLPPELQEWMDLPA